MKIEVLGTERRRRWSLQDKLQIVEETMQPGVTVTEVARRHGLAPSVVFSAWCLSSIPESRKAMPTPLPSRPAACPPAGLTIAGVVAPVIAPRKLDVRIAGRFGEIESTSARCAIELMIVPGMIAEKPGIDW